MEFEEPSWDCATTGAGGEYIIPELPSSEYYVEFTVPQESSLYYVTQYYHDKSSLLRSPTSHVSKGKQRRIDAKMQEGGEISEAP